jgi:hypothetical protein
MEQVGGLEEVKDNYSCICKHTCFVLHREGGVTGRCAKDTRLYVVLADDLSVSDVQGLMKDVAGGKSLLADVDFAEILFHPAGADPLDEHPIVDLLRQDQLHEPIEANIYKGKLPKRWPGPLPSDFLNLRGNHSFEVRSYDDRELKDNSHPTMPPIMLDVRYRSSKEENKNLIEDALVSKQGDARYGVGLRFNWGQGHVLLTSLNIERWPMQSEWHPDGLAAFATLIDSIVPDNGKSQGPCECNYSCWRAFFRRVVQRFELE